MISYHPDPQHPYDMKKHTYGYKTLDTNNPIEIAKYVLQYVWGGIYWDKGHREESKFQYSDWCLLDFDDHDKSLAWAVKNFCDVTHVIGTTRNHQISKDGAAPHDRFRVAIPWSSRIVALRDYRFTMRQLIKKYGADTKCEDGARAFYKCSEIVSVNECAEGMDWQSCPEAELRPWSMNPESYARACNYRALKWSGTQSLKPWVRDFLEQGIPFGKGRNISVYTAALDLFEANFTFDDVAAMIAAAPLKNRHGFTNEEMLLSIKSAEKTFTKRMTGNVADIRSKDQRAANDKKNKAGECEASKQF